MDCQKFLIYTLINIIFTSEPIHSISIKIPKDAGKAASFFCHVFFRDTNSDGRVFRVSSPQRFNAAFRALFRHEIGHFLSRSRRGRRRERWRTVKSGREEATETEKEKKRENEGPEEPALPFG